MAASLWSAQWQCWNTWGVPVMEMPPLIHSLAAAVEQRLPALLALGPAPEEHPVAELRACAYPQAILPSEGGGIGPPSTHTAILVLLMKQSWAHPAPACLITLRTTRPCFGG